MSVHVIASWVVLQMSSILFAAHDSATASVADLATEYVIDLQKIRSTSESLTAAVPHVMTFSFLLCSTVSFYAAQLTF